MLKRVIDRDEWVTPEQWGRLPKFARDYIAQLEMRYVEAERAFTTSFKNPMPESKVVVDPYSEYAIALRKSGRTDDQIW